MMSTRFASLLVLGLLVSGLARAETLPLPDNLTGFDTGAGEKLLLDADAREAYFPLASNFVT